MIGGPWGNLIFSQVLCLSTKKRLLEHATGATGTGEVVSRTAAQTPPPTRAGGQDDGSYTNSLKLLLGPHATAVWVYLGLPGYTQVYLGSKIMSSASPSDRI